MPPSFLYLISSTSTKEFEVVGSVWVWCACPQHQAFISGIGNHLKSNCWPVELVRPPFAVWITAKFITRNILVIHWRKFSSAKLRQAVEVNQNWLQLFYLQNILPDSISIKILAAIPPPSHYRLGFVQTKPAYCHEKAHYINHKGRKMISQEIDETFDCLGFHVKMSSESLKAQFLTAFLCSSGKPTSSNPKSKISWVESRWASLSLSLPLPVPFPTIVACLLPPLGRLLHPLFFMARRNSVFVWREAGKHEVCAE